jgi:FkbM family methyltransferase
MYDLLVYNINQNNLQNKIIPFHAGVFCYNGPGHMHDIDLDGGGGVIEKRYTTECDLPCNFGGASLGKKGEMIVLVTVDDMFIEDNDIGYIHCDAQGAENYIFSRATNTLMKNRPVIFYENNFENVENGKYLFDNVHKNYPEFEENSRFNLRNFCVNQLGYSKYIHKFNNGNDDLLIP